MNGFMHDFARGFPRNYVSFYWFPREHIPLDFLRQLCPACTRAPGDRLEEHVQCSGRCLWNRLHHSVLGPAVAVWVGRLPPPRVLAHLLYPELRTPAERLLGLCRVRVAVRNARSNPTRCQHAAGVECPKPWRRMAGVHWCSLRERAAALTRLEHRRSGAAQSSKGCRSRSLPSSPECMGG
jgi:hypothetical protein